MKPAGSESRKDMPGNAEAENEKEEPLDSAPAVALVNSSPRAELARGREKRFA